MMYQLPSSNPNEMIPIPTELRESLSHLDIVWSDMFENEDINPDAARQHEVNFLRGDPPTWLNFNTAVNLALVERDGFNDLKQKIEESKTKHCLIADVSLMYEPGSGGSTLAMQVLWHFRKDLRCARVKDSQLDINQAPNLAKQVVDLFLLSSKRDLKQEQDQKTVLLLLENNEKTYNYLRKCLIEEIYKGQINTNTPIVIILWSPRNSTIETVKLQKELSEDEKKRFAQKRQEVESKHQEKSQIFHAFNIMVGGFKKVDAEKVITQEMKNYIEKHKESSSSRLLSFLALINSYVPGSHLSKNLCEVFIAQAESQPNKENLALEMAMKPFMDLILISSEGEQGECIRLAHPMIANACLKTFNDHMLTRFDIAVDFLNNMVKGKEDDYVQICNRMLLMRQEDSKEKDEFSKLILDLLKESKNNTSKRIAKPNTGKNWFYKSTLKDTDHTQCIQLLERASEMFSEDPSYPQALARYYYINVKDYYNGELQAEEAIERDERKSFIRDTLGRVHKSHLKTKLNQTQLDVQLCLEIAKSAINSFKVEWEAAEVESESVTEFNSRGYLGFLQVCKLIDPQNSQFCKFISDHKVDVETRYDFFEWFLTYSKPGIKKEEPDYIRKEIESCYKQYCTQSSQSEETALNEKKMKSFAGLLQSDITVLQHNHNLIKSPQSDDESEIILYILANILSQSTESPEKTKELQASLQKLWDSENKGRSPEFYLLILLLFWPDEAEAITNPPDLEECVKYMEDSYNKKYEKYFRSRYLVPLFFLGKGTGLKRLIHTSKLQQNTSEVSTNIDKADLKLLTEGDGNAEVECLQRVDGIVRNHEVFAFRGEKQTKVEAHDLASVFRQGSVSFYLGFTIRGPVAFNIKYDHCK